LDNVFDINNCAAILLAAGASSRLGKPKQLLLYKGKTLLQNALSAAKSSQLNPIVVVLGADATFIGKKIEETNIHIVYNPEWQEGIASSIRHGIQELEKIASDADAAIIMVCDQPHITSSLLNDLLTAQQQTKKPIVASRYNGVAGTPALFHKTIFPELLLLKGDKGAGKILREETNRVTTIPFPLGAIDIDTADNYEKLMSDI
jgi:molybdenum cofactor cytidylyltransferase